MSSYQFSPGSAPQLQRFLAAASSCACGPSRDTWRSHLALPAPPPPPSPHTHAHAHDAVIELSSDDTPDVPAPEHVTTHSDEETKLLCEIIEYESTDSNSIILSEDLVSRCSKNGAVLNYLAKNLTENAAVKLSDAVCASASSEKILNNYFQNFLPMVLKYKDHTRNIDQLLIRNYRKLPAKFINEFLPLFLNDPEIPAQIFLNIVKAITRDETKTVLNEIFNIDFSNRQFITHVPSILILYKNLENYNPYVETSVLKLLSRYCEEGSKNNSYGKFLLALIHKMDPSSGHFECVESLCAINQTIFKKTCTNALNKIKN